MRPAEHRDERVHPNVIRRITDELILVNSRKFSWKTTEPVAHGAYDRWDPHEAAKMRSKYLASQKLRSAPNWTSDVCERMDSWTSDTPVSEIPGKYIAKYYCHRRNYGVSEMSRSLGVNRVDVTAMVKHLIHPLDVHLVAEMILRLNHALYKKDRDLSGTADERTEPGHVPEAFNEDEYEDDF